MGKTKVTPAVAELKIESSAEYRQLPLDQIQADPNQPRTFYDETSMNELLGSIREKGVIQPVLVRPIGENYIIVCGERRYRASVSLMKEDATRNTIPAIIREISDEEALELQIIENLQRKDVHPMEEAVAFKSLLEQKKWTVEEIGHRVGKKDFFVRQRLKLNELTREFQHLFFHNAINLSDALQLAILPFSTQKEVYTGRDLTESTKYFRVDDWMLRQFKGDLVKAPFDITDPKLSPDFGSCIGCKYNSATSALFPDDVKSPRCLMISDYKLKSENYFAREFENAKEDPTVLLVSSSYGGSDLQAKLIKQGLNVLCQYKDYEEISEPEIPDYKDFYDDNFDEDDEDYDTEEKIKFLFEKEQEEYISDKSEYDQKIATGKFKKAFVIDGNEPGKFIYVTVKKGAATKNTGTQGSSVQEDSEIESINSEIDGIKQRTKRAAELDDEKVWARIYNEILPQKDLINGDTLSKIDKAAHILAMKKHLGYTATDQFKKIFGTTDEKKLIEVLKNATPEQENQVTRLFTLQSLKAATGSHSRNSDLMVIKLQAEQYHSEKIQAIESEQKEKRDKREERANGRIKSLQLKKKELVKPVAAKKSKKPF